MVVGGCGFLGHHIVNLLSGSHGSSQISVLDLHTTRNRLPASSKVQYFDADITSADSIRPVFQKVKPDVIIHTASPTLLGADEKLMRKVNVEGTRTLLELAGETKVKAFVYTSSASVISSSTRELINATEEWPYVPKAKQNDYYSQTKADAEALVIAANRKPEYNNLLTTALRPAGLVGEGDVQIIPQMLRALRKGQTGFQLGDNDNLFDFTYVGNAAHAHVLAAVALLGTHSESQLKVQAASEDDSSAPWIPSDERVDGEVFHVTNDSPIYFWDFPRLVWRCAGDTRGNNVWVIPKDWGLLLATIFEWVFWLWGGKPNLTRREVNYACITRYYSCDKAKRRLGYEPITGLEEGIRRGVTWALKREEQEEAEKKASGGAAEKKQQ
ncbi:MAG: erg26, C-3 sterol dehydrogenase [Sclerophora amabilis]|nr:MAG: erg26, C-3 sterol dehydrogenase [Sclerophora amabilis]